MTSSNFTLVNGGLGGAPAITTVTPIGSAPATAWTVTASTGTGQGTLGLNMTSAVGLTHDVTNLNFTGQVYDIDKIAPTVSNVSSNANTGCILNVATDYCNAADTVSIQVTFSEAVSVVGTPQLTLETGAIDQTIDYASGSGTDTLTFTYTVQAGDTSTDLDYTSISALALNGATIQDGATNNATLTLATPGAAGSLRANEDIVVDTTAPTTSYFQRRTPVTNPTGSDTLQFEVDFSESIGGPGTIGTNDFVLTGTTATVTGVGLVNFSNGTYSLDVSGGDLANLNGVVGLNFSLTMSITDQAGNPVANVEPSTDETYTMDNSAPTVTINQAAGQNDPTGDTLIDFTVVFSEAVTDFDDAADVTITGTAVATTVLITGGPITYNVAVSGMVGNGTVIANIPAGAATDSTNLSAASTTGDNTVTYDATQPTVTINTAVGQPDPAGSGPINFTVVFSETVSDFDDAADVTLSASTTPGTLSTVITGGPTTYNVAVSGMTGDGSVIATVPAGAATDGSNLSAASTSPVDNSVLYDTTSPSVTVDQAVGQNDPANASPINFRVVFSEAVTDFETADLGDVDLSAGSAPGALTFVISGGPTIYNVAVSGMSGPGTVLASIPASVAVDLASKPNGASTPIDNSVTFDATAPDSSINTNPSNPTTSTSAAFTFSGTDSGTGVASLQCDLDGGGFSTCTSPKSYTGLGDGSHTLQVRAIDNAGNMDATPASFTWVVDATAPDTTITANPANPANSTTANFDFSGNDGAGTGIASFECKLDAAAFAACTSTKTYNALSNGSHTFQVWAIDAAGNVDGTPASFTWIVDSVAPTMTINQAATQSDPTGNSPINFTVVFSEPITGFGSGDVNLGGTCQATTFAVTEIAPNNGTTFNVEVSGMAGTGTVIASVISGSVQDIAANLNSIASTSTDNSVTYDISTKDITAFSFTSPAAIGSISGTNISITVPSGTNVTALVATFTTTGASVAVGATPQVSATTANDFTNPVIYTVTAVDASTKDYTVTVTFSGGGGGPNPIFADVPFSHWANSYIERLYKAGITGGCGTMPLTYCPDATVTRAQMAIFILRGIHGKAYSPPPASGTVFADVPAGAFAADWIEQLALEGITSGCGNSNYCPDATITRAEMSIFLLRGEHGSAYTPPTATGTVFGDVPLGSFAVDWIEQLAFEGITSGCGGGNYCPDNSVTRAEMAVFLVRAFGLP
ncbi:S-layer homology domain-containing protein [Candidatus Villigracilis affinis]|uniref:S-layer homology domain-containing protein n=1 Tax=Candidatus Villigracilis affinis TaxID=3140682 RepID=UPI001D6D21A7|nr:S-layer homology domain-containing protein [Anaerolineales bacterium]